VVQDTDVATAVAQRLGSRAAAAAAAAAGAEGLPRVGRNDPCPCGSGKKYKKCHGANQ
jgi:preprotein translocase subunit SecA